MTTGALQKDTSSFSSTIELGFNGLLIDATAVKGSPTLTITSTDGVNLTLGADGGTLFAGDAATAEALATPRDINGVAFDGTEDITVTADASTVTGDTLASNVVTSSLTTVGVLTSLQVSGYSKTDLLVQWELVHIVSVMVQISLM